MIGEFEVVVDDKDNLIISGEDVYLLGFSDALPVSDRKSPILVQCNEIQLCEGCPDSVLEGNVVRFRFPQANRLFVALVYNPSFRLSPRDLPRLD